MSSDATPRTPDRRRLIIDAARALFTQHSYEKVTTTEIARKAGVAYGLIAHHFGNKRGLYLAVMSDIKAELAAEQDAPPGGTAPGELLRHALARHVDYIDAHAAGFTALMRGGLGADPEMRSMLGELRAVGGTRVLRALGVTGPPPPALRSALHAWVAYFDELMLDRIQFGDIGKRAIVELAAESLLSSVRTVISLDPGIELLPEITDYLELP
jgi:AcrR family transcriptional regulator